MDFQNPEADDGAEAPNGTRTLNGEPARRRRSVSGASSAQPPNETASRTRTPAVPATTEENDDIAMEEAEGTTIPSTTGQSIRA